MSSSSDDRDSSSRKPGSDATNESEFPPLELDVQPTNPETKREVPDEPDALDTVESIELDLSEPEKTQPSPAFKTTTANPGATYSHAATVREENGLLLPQTPAEPVYGRFWVRGAALFLDSVPLFIAGELLLHLNALLLFYLHAAYASFFCASRFQATPGKMFFKLRVVGKTGDTLTLGQAFVRSLLSYLFQGLSWLFAAFTPKKQALHDLAIGSTVVADEESSDLKVIATILGSVFVIYKLLPKH